MNALAPLTVPIVADDRIARSVFAKMRAETATFARGLSLETAKVQASMGKVEAAMAGAQTRALAFRSTMTGLLGAGGIGASLATALGVREFITNTIEAEQSLAQLEAVVRSTGGAAGMTTGQLTALAGETQRLTTYGDDAVVGAEALLLTFTKIGQDVFPDAVRSILDVSTAMKQDLQSATVQVGKALNDPIKGLAALSKAGIQFTEAQKAMIKALVEAGDLVGAQRIMLKELETQFGGSARAARETLGGALAALKNRFGDMFEVGTEGSEDLRLGIEGVVAVLSDPSTIAAVQGFGGALFSEFARAIEVAREFGASIEALKAGDFTTFMELSMYPADAEGRQANFAAKLRTGLVEMRADIAETAAFYDEFGNTFESTTAKATMAVDDMTAAAELAKSTLRQGLAGEAVALSDTLKGQFATAFGDVDKAAVKAGTTIQNVTDQLKFEAAQLQRTAREQAIYNALKQAGVGIDSAAGKEIADLAGGLYDVEAAQESFNDRLKEAQGLATGFFDTLFDGLTDGEGLVSSLSDSVGGLAGNLAGDFLSTSIGNIGSSLGGTAGSMLGSIGGPLGSALGSAAGSLLGDLVGDLFGDNEEMEKAQEAWRGMQDQVLEFSSMLRGEVAGDMRSAIDDAEAQLIEFRKAAREAGEGTAQLNRDFKRFRDDQIDDFNRIFKARVKAYRSGLGADDAFLQGAEAMAALRDEVLAFVDDAKLAGGGRGRKAERASQDLVLSTIGGGGQSELSEYEAEVKRIKGTRSQAIALLKDLGVKEKKARELVNAQIELAIAEAERIRDEAIAERSQGFQDRLFAATTDLTSLEGQLAAFDREAQREREDELLAGGEAMAELEKTLAAERLKIQRDFTDASIEEAKRAQEEIDRTALGIAEYVNGLLAGPQSTASPLDQFTAAEAAFNAQYALAQGGNADAQAGITGYAETFRQAAREMYASSTAYQDIQSDIIQKLLALPAVEQADDPVVLALLDAIAAIQGTTSAVSTLQAGVVSAIAAGPAATADLLAPYFEAIDIDASGGITLAEMQTALGTTNARLLSIFQTLDADGDGTISKLELIAARTLDTASKVTGVAKDASLTSVNGLKGINDKVNGVAKDATLTGTDSDTGTGFGGIKFHARRTGNWAQNTANKVNDLGTGVVPWIPVMATRLYEISDRLKSNDPLGGPDKQTKGTLVKGEWENAFARGGMIPGYAPGGIVGNGTWNVDSVRARYAGGGDIMLAGGEGVINAQAMRTIGPSRFDLLNRGMMPGGTDNGPHFERLANVIHVDFGMQNRVLMAGFRGVIETLQAENATLRAEVSRSGESTARAIRERPVPQRATLRA